MSFVVDAGAALALHFLDERDPFEPMEERLLSGAVAFTALNFFQEVMEGSRRGVRDGRTKADSASAWLTLLDAFPIEAVDLTRCAGSTTWLVAEQLNISAYDAGYITVAKARGLELFTMDAVIRRRAPIAGVIARP